MRTEVIIDFDVEGYHQWPNAPDIVSFLRSRHRHIFQIRAGIVVSHQDRDREIFMETAAATQILMDKYGNEPFEFGCNSCEMIASLILLKTPGCTWVEVFEDHRGGARVTQ